MISHTDPPFRVVTIGDASVGKTSITNRLIEDNFNPFEPSTIGANYQPYITFVNSKKVEIQIWDTAGQEKFKSLTPIYFRNAVAAIAVFSLCKKDSFEKIGEWITSFREIAGYTSIVYIAANKVDLVDEVIIDNETSDSFARSLNCKIFKTSAKTGEGIKEMFISLAEDLVKQKNEKDNTVKSKRPAQREDSGCC